MIVCPACNERSFGHREFLAAGPGSGARCKACGEIVRLDSMSRCLVACALAMTLWTVLFYGNLFYSGYLFLFSTLLIFAGWPILCTVALPLLSLERWPQGVCLDRRQNTLIVAIMIVCALGIDALLSYRSDADKAHASTAAAGMRQR